MAWQLNRLASRVLANLRSQQTPIALSTLRFVQQQDLDVLFLRQYQQVRVGWVVREAVRRYSVTNLLRVELVKLGR